MSNTRSFALGVITAPLMLMLFMAMALPAVPGYHPLHSLISSLSLGETAWVGTLFFTLSAATLAALAAALSRAFAPDRRTSAAVVLLSVAAVCLLALIFIDIDHVSGVWTLKRAVHWAVAGTAMAGFGAAAALTTLRLKREPGWRGVYLFSIVLAVAALAIAAALALTMRAGLAALLERLLLGAGVLWIEAVAFQMLRRKNPPIAGSE